MPTKLGPESAEISGISRGIFEVSRAEREVDKRTSVKDNKPAMSEPKSFANVFVEGSFFNCESPEGVMEVR